MKVFISQSMHGLTDDEVIVERNHAIVEVKGLFPKENVEIIEKCFDDRNSENRCVALRCLAKSIECLADADVAVFCRGFKGARKCRMEYRAAIDYGIKVIEL